MNKPKLTVIAYRKPENLQEVEFPGWYIVTASDNKEYEWHTYFVKPQDKPKIGDKFEPFVDPHTGSAVVSWMSVERVDEIKTH